MLRCPYCHRQALTFWRKLWLGPSKSIPCSSCGASISVSWWVLAAIIVPFTVTDIFASMMFPPSDSVFWWSSAVGALVALAVSALAVPVVRRGT